MMTDDKAIRIVSILFLITAILTVLDFLFSLGQSRILIPWGILGFWIFLRLPSYQRPWRLVALILLLIPIVLFPIVTVMAVLSDAPTYFEMFGVRIAQVPLFVFVIGMSFFWLIYFWQYRVLMRPSIRDKFMMDADEVGVRGREEAV